jgi:hypothetical protein
MAVTHKLIETVTVGSGGAANIEFTSIPQTYTDLLLLCSLDQSNSSVVVDIRFNGLSTDLSSRLLLGNGSVASSTSASALRSYGTNPSDFTASIFSNMSIYISNYAGSANKSVSIDAVTENNATEAFCNFTAGLWSASAAITQITLIASGGNMVQHSSVSLYGIKNS